MSVAATDLCRMSVTELAGAIRSRQASSWEVIEAHLQRIEAVNPSVNAITIVLADQALEAATAADRRSPRLRWRTGSASSRPSIPRSRPRTQAGDVNRKGAGDERVTHGAEEGGRGPGRARNR
jgi:hypothetical protein